MFYMLTLRMFYKTFYIVLFCCFQQYVVSLDKGDFCTLNSGDSGICESLVKCPAALQGLQNRVIPTNCGGFDGTVPIVCCKNDNVNPPPITQTTPKITTQKPTPRPTPAPTRATTKTVDTATFVNPPGIGHIARAKCWEYKQYVYEEVYPAVLLPGTQKIKRDGCGHTVVKLIVGGTEATPKEFPHMASLGYDAQGQVVWKCGGTLISERFVLTAAHCLFARELGYVRYVRLGDLDIATNKDDARPQEIPVERDGIYKHPMHTSKLKYNDIALLKMKYAAELNPYVRPACLYTKDEIGTKSAIATGWGKTDYAGPESSHLLKVVLDMYTNQLCNETYDIDSKLENGIIDTQVCAGTLEDKTKDTCQGDSGGPLQIYNLQAYCMYDVVGVTSFGKACGIASTPGVYTRVSKYLEWIESTVWQ